MSLSLNNVHKAGENIFAIGIDTIITMKLLFYFILHHQFCFEKKENLFRGKLSSILSPMQEKSEWQTLCR